MNEQILSMLKTINSNLEHLKGMENQLERIYEATEAMRMCTERNEQMMTKALTVYTQMQQQQQSTNDTMTF